MTIERIFKARCSFEFDGRPCSSILCSETWEVQMDTESQFKKVAKLEGWKFRVVDGETLAFCSLEHWRDWRET